MIFWIQISLLSDTLKAEIGESGVDQPTRCMPLLNLKLLLQFKDGCEFIAIQSLCWDVHWENPKGTDLSITNHCAWWVSQLKTFSLMQATGVAQPWHLRSSTQSCVTVIIVWFFLHNAGTRSKHTKPGLVQYSSDQISMIIAAANIQLSPKGAVLCREMVLTAKYDFARIFWQNDWDGWKQSHLQISFLLKDKVEALFFTRRRVH